MLELVVLTEEVVAERAAEDPATVFPHAPLTLQTHRVCQWAGARMCGQTLATVTHPALTEVTYGTLNR